MKSDDAFNDEAIELSTRIYSVVLEANEERTLHPMLAVAALHYAMRTVLMSIGKVEADKFDRLMDGFMHDLNNPVN